MKNMYSNNLGVAVIIGDSSACIAAEQLILANTNIKVVIVDDATVRDFRQVQHEVERGILIKDVKESVLIKPNILDIKFINRHEYLKADDIPKQTHHRKRIPSNHKKSNNKKSRR